ncbi:MAG: pyroglutamyl-peptidase I [Symbiobacteriaceae bacterium]|nr:pyroglutamyl-peptidase I [Symbiobacteriaceae bacterium]
MPKILLTGFQPFGGEVINPSWQVASHLNGVVIDGYEIVAAEIPVARFEALDLIISLIEKHQPEIIINVGQAGGRQEITVERIGINVDDYGAPDNAGNQPIDEPIEEGGPAAVFSTLPVKAMVEAMRIAGVPAAVSNSAGTYLCNHVAYGIPRYLQKNSSEAVAGFIHIPFLPEQAAKFRGRSSMALDTLILGFTVAIKAIIANPKADIKAVGGVTH